MKNWKKYALASASVIALGATLAACEALQVTTRNQQQLKMVNQSSRCTKSVTNQTTWIPC